MRIKIRKIDVIDIVKSSQTSFIFSVKDNIHSLLKKGINVVS
ncbi:hypothetical protein BAOM_2889 [Peribacillus asahii]|uniref:Uncharacterized protein n=1 Tax=Peribacillus asahii TaxID=228899 RepID=A0A3Q9RNV7_9BACI|nr:hypothetical protein BAOM_2889 [Peribacillus asahii]